MTTTDPMPPTADLPDDPVNDDDLDTWIERRMFDDHTAPEIAEHVEPQTASHPLNGWRPADKAVAEWAMAKLVRLERELADINTEHDAWAEAVESSRRNATRTLEYRARFFREALTGYAIAWRDEAPTERGTLHLPSGTVSTTRPTKPTVQLVPAEKAELVGWLRSLDRNVVTMAKALKVVDPEPMISGVRKLVEARQVGGEWKVIDPATGEVLPGLRADPPGPTTATPKPDLS